MAKRRTFQRPLGERRYKKLFVISVEGANTEPQYFALFNSSQSIVMVKCLQKKRTDSSPLQVLKTMKNHLRNEGLRKTDEAWLVVDKDEWKDEQLRVLVQWSKESDNHGFALSNPNFEYWLLLHFEEAKGVSNAQECLTRLKKHLPEYKKCIDSKRFTLERIQQAILRAKTRKANRDDGLWPMASTSVYKLVEKILKQH
jgi:hypothetical protein